MNAYIWAILTALTWGCVPLIEKMGLARLEPQVGLFYRCFGVLAGIALLLIFYAKEIRASWAHWHSGMVFVMLGGFLASVVGQLFFYHALKTGEASRVVPLGATYPLVAFVLGVLILGEKVTVAKTAGIALVLSGVYFLR